MKSISDVALLAGVSKTTVSHVINHPERVTKVLRERVESAIKELGYQPSPFAQNLRTGKKNLLALIVPDITNSFFSELVQTIQEIASAEGYELLFYNTDVLQTSTPDRVQSFIKLMSPKRFDGVIISGEMCDGGETLLEHLGVTGAYIGYLSKPILDNVFLDDFQAAYQATKRLIDKGHTRIAHLSGDQRYHSGSERLRGYKKALRDHKLDQPAELTFHGSFLRPSGREGMRYFWGLKTRPTAVFIGNALMTFGAMRTAVDLGWRVPEDIAVVSFDETEEMHDVRPRLTTISYNPRVVGKIAIELLLSRIQGMAPKEVRSIEAPFQLISGDSDGT